MFRVYDRIRETTTSGGSGSVVLTAYNANYLRFSNVYLDNCFLPYAIIDSNAFEVGIGYLVSGSLYRQEVLSSTNYTNNAGTVTFSPVNFTAGTTKDVFVPAPARLAPIVNANPTDSYSGSQFVVYGLNQSSNTWEWQLVPLTSGSSSLLGGFPNNRILYVSGSTFATNPNLTFDPTLSTNNLQLVGDFYINGNLKSNAKLFSVPHPNKPGYILNHGSLEGPELGMYFRTQEKIIKKITIKIPEYFLSMSDNYSVLLSTQDGTRASWGVNNGVLEIERHGIFLKPTEISVLIIGERHDVPFVMEEQA